MVIYQKSMFLTSKKAWSFSAKIIINHQSSSIINHQPSICSSLNFAIENHLSFFVQEEYSAKAIYVTIAIIVVLGKRQMIKTVYIVEPGKLPG